MATKSSPSVGHFGTVDYVFFVLLLMVSLALGFFASRRGRKSPEEFLMGGRTMSPFPVAVSVLASLISAISLLGYTGEVYARGFTLYITILSGVFGAMVATHVILVVLFPLKLTSVNEYIDLRFRCPPLRCFVTALSVVHNYMYMGICLYAPTVALAAVTPLDSTTCIYILGIVCTLYSSIGGLRAVIWTDIVQFGIMVFGILVVSAAGCIYAGGIEEAISKAYAGGRLQFGEMNWDLHKSNNIVTLIMFGFFFWGKMFGVSQLNFQRMCSVPSLRQSQRMMYFAMTGFVILYFFIFSTGFILYAVYYDCDPTAIGLIQKKEEIVPFFLKDKLRILFGLPGLYVATLFSGALSSISSALTANVAMIWKDFLLKFKYFSKLSAVEAARINMITSFLSGALVICTALLASNASGIASFSFTISGTILGPVYGVFLAGILLPNANAKGVFTGVVFATAFLVWIVVGAFVYVEPASVLPYSADGCKNQSQYQMMHHLLNNTLEDNKPAEFILPNELTDSLKNESLALDATVNIEDKTFLYGLYNITYFLYPTIGALMAMTIAAFVSALTGGAQTRVPDNLLFPAVRTMCGRLPLPEIKIQEPSTKMKRSRKSKKDNNSRSDNNFELTNTNTG